MWRAIPDISGARPCIVVWCVDVEKQPAVAIEGHQLIRTDLSYGELRQRVADAQFSGHYTAVQVSGNASCVRGT